ncbi:MAG TPA: hypothetical protein PLV28_04580, partial [Bacilli bacterium]|nr:hypothetical protein [Bacilli bacterium]
MADENKVTIKQEQNVVAEEVAKEETAPKTKKDKPLKVAGAQEKVKKAPIKDKAKKAADTKPKQTKKVASKKSDTKAEKAKKAKADPKKADAKPETEKVAEKATETKASATKEKTPKAEPKKEAPKKAAPRRRRLSAMELRKREALKGYKRFTKVRSRYYSFLNRTVKQSKPTTNLYNTIANKAPTLSGITRNEVKRFDPEFIEKIERVIPSLEEIVVNPHKFINEFAEVVQVEKA